MNHLIIILLCLSYLNSPPLYSVEIRGVNAEKVVENADDEYLKKLIEGYNKFAFNLYRTIGNRQENSMIASYVLGTAMSMIGEGAKGETKKEIEEALQFSLNIAPFTQTLNEYLNANRKQVRQMQLSMIPGVWVQNETTLLPSYKYSLKRNFNFDLTPIDFKAPSKAFSTINEWMSNQSDNKINQLIFYQDFSPKTQLIATSGFYWKGEWLHPFDIKQTQKAAFTYRGSTFNVEMMRQIAIHSLLIQPRFTIINIPFKPFQQGGAQLSLTILLPNEGINLNEVENEFVIDQWYQWMGELKPQRVELFLPKFRMEKQSDLSLIMQELGIQQAFNASADFSAIDTQKIYLNKVIQKVYGTINEGGSDAPISRSVPSPQLKEESQPYVVKINRPFLFVIQETTTRLILCIGKIEQP